MINVTQKTFERNKIMSLFFSILVVSMHVSNLERYQVYSFPGFTASAVIAVETFLSSFLANAAVPFFFFSSGFLFFRTKLSPMEAAIKTRQRLASLGIPYLLWNMIFYAYFLVLTRLPIISDAMNMGTVPFSINELFESVLFYKYNYVFWFVFQLLIYFCLSPLLAIVLRKKWSTILIGFFIFVLANFTNQVFFLRIDGLLYFFSGACTVNYVSECSMVVRILKNKWITIFLGIGAFCMYSFAMPYLGRMISLLYPFIIMWVAYIFLPQRIRALHGLENATFFLYAFHTLIIEIYKKVLYLLLPHTPVVALLAYVGVLVATLFTTEIVVRFMIRFTPHLYAMLVGNRGRKVC